MMVVMITCPSPETTATNPAVRMSAGSSFKPTTKSSSAMPTRPEQVYKLGIRRHQRDAGRPHKDADKNERDDNRLPQQRRDDGRESSDTENLNQVDEFV